MFTCKIISLEIFPFIKSFVSNRISVIDFTIFIDGSMMSSISCSFKIKSISVFRIESITFSVRFVDKI